MIFDHKTIVDYFESLVNTNTDLQAFFRMDLNEVFGALRSGVEFPVLALESFEGNFSGTTATNTNNQNLLAFSILKNPTAGDFDQQNNFINDCLLIGFECLAKMRFNSKQPNHFLHDNFMLQDVSYAKVGPLYTEELFGYRFEIPLKQKIALKVDPQKWQDIDADCPE